MDIFKKMKAKKTAKKIEKKMQEIFMISARDKGYGVISEDWQTFMWGDEDD